MLRLPSCLHPGNQRPKPDCAQANSEVLHANSVGREFHLPQRAYCVLLGAHWGLCISSRGLPGLQLLVLDYCGTPMTRSSALNINPPHPASHDLYSAQNDSNMVICDVCCVDAFISGKFHSKLMLRSRTSPRTVAATNQLDQLMRLSEHRGTAPEIPHVWYFSETSRHLGQDTDTRTLPYMVVRLQHQDSEEG